MTYTVTYADGHRAVLWNAHPEFVYILADIRRFGLIRFDGVLLIFFRLGVEGEEAEFVRFAEIIE